MSTINTCANCGKGEESSDSLKACTACKMVNYCNRECQLAHRSQHKKACRKRAAELHDKALFKEPPPPNDCPICFLPLPSAVPATFFTCCGTNIYEGCVFAVAKTGAKKLCPICRTPPSRSDEEEVRRTEKLMEKGNRRAFYQLAAYYREGIKGMPQDQAKANELYLKAGELGCAEAYYNLGIMYSNGRGVTIDKKKAKNYYELAAINGDISAMYHLGRMEGQDGNFDRAMKHSLIAASAGHELSLDVIKKGFMHGLVTKDEYANTLREYQKSQDEMKSEARDKAQAFRNNNEEGTLDALRAGDFF